ncbi:MAG: hypothetical protein LAT62_15620 [Natronospirillum sp.]|uniref:hypothetical protein n=1 Tax=Natronospirillum sp. TaxID=2812955 RepID=UPI0025EC16E8|nr:hypothetical protein [Natronospirillum sp.]MCH8553366.1 hypothetical protein [Natronospirillum sp.]
MTDPLADDRDPRMTFASILLGFTFGLLFLAGGVLVLLAGQWIGAVLLAIALLLLPPVRYLVWRLTGKRLSAVKRAFSIALLLALFVILLEFFAETVAPQVTEQTPLPELMQPQSREE